MITFERASELLSYDSANGSFVWRATNSNRVKVGARAGNASGRYLVIAIDGVNYRGHRLAWLLSHKDMPADRIDHKNGNPFDNRLENLRLATQQQNLGNTRRPRHNRSGVKGVHWDASRNKWHAQISVMNKSKSLGRFNQMDDAKAAYASAAAQQFGEFARLD